MSERDKRSDRPRVLVLGASGLNGGAIVAQLGERGGVEVVCGARDPRTVANWKDEGKAAVLVDLDERAAGLRECQQLGRQRLGEGEGQRCPPIGGCRVAA